jgi:hypothetical protein
MWDGRDTPLIAAAAGTALVSAVWSVFGATRGL